jgi:hypothetical protein
LKDQRVDGRMGSKWTSGRLAEGMWGGFTWIRMELVGGLLWMRWWTLGFWRHGVIYWQLTVHDKPSHFNPTGVLPPPSGVTFH